MVSDKLGKKRMSAHPTVGYRPEDRFKLIGRARKAGATGGEARGFASGFGRLSDRVKKRFRRL